MQAYKQHYLYPDVKKNNLPDHILSLLELQLKSAVSGATEVSSAVPGLDRGVGQVSGVNRGPSRLPGQNRVNRVKMMRRMTIRTRLLLPFTSQGLGDGATPHQVVTGPINILSEKKCVKNFEYFRNWFPKPIFIGF